MGSQAERDRTLAELRGRIERLERSGRSSARARAVLAFGVECVDQHLPGGGLRLGALHEVAPGGAAAEHGAAAILFTAGILARIRGPVLWCLTSRDLFAPGLARAGLHPDRVLYAETWREREVLPVMEEAARHPGLAGVVGEVGRLSLSASRRLQLAAEASGVTAFVLRRWQTSEENGAGEGSAAASRWQVTALPSAPLRAPGLGRGRWQVALTRSRGAPSGADAACWTVEACDEAGRLGLPADLAHGSHPQAGPERAAAR